LYPPDNFFTNNDLRKDYKNFFDLTDLKSFPSYSKASQLRLFCTSCKEIGRGPNTDIQLCQPCKANCLICQDGFQCKVCKGKFFLHPVTSECTDQSFVEISLNHFSNTSTTLFILTLDLDWPIFTNYLTQNKRKSIVDISFVPSIPAKSFSYNFAGSVVPQSVLLNFTFYQNVTRGTVLKINFEDSPVYDSQCSLLNRNLTLALRGFKSCPKKGYGYSAGKNFSFIIVIINRIGCLCTN